MSLTKKDLKPKTIFACVSRTWGVGIRSASLKKPVSLEDCARGYWRVVNSVKARQCECLMAVCRGEIVGVWEIDTHKGWMAPALTPKKTWPEDKGDGHPRLGCEFVSAANESGEVISMRKLFMHKFLHDIDGMDARGGAIHYSF